MVNNKMLFFGTILYKAHVCIIRHESISVLEDIRFAQLIMGVAACVLVVQKWIGNPNATQNTRGVENSNFKCRHR